MRLSGPSWDRYGWRRFDAATAEVVHGIDIAAGPSIAGTTIGIINTSPKFPGSGTGTGQQVGGGFWTPGRSIKCYLWGTITTGATPGTITIDFRLDTTGGTALCTSGALTLLASQTTSSFKLELTATCRTIGTAGTLFAMGQFECGTALLAAGAAFLPATAPATATIDTTADHVIVACVTESQAGTSTITQIATWAVRN